MKQNQTMGLRQNFIQVYFFQTNVAIERYAFTNWKAIVAPSGSATVGVLSPCAAPWAHLTRTVSDVSQTLGVPRNVHLVSLELWVTWCRMQTLKLDLLSPGVLVPSHNHPRTLIWRKSKVSRNHPRSLIWRRYEVKIRLNYPWRYERGEIEHLWMTWLQRRNFDKNK